jgi:hypothetical protein
MVGEEAMADKDASGVPQNQSPTPRSASAAPGDPSPAGTVVTTAVVFLPHRHTLHFLIAAIKKPDSDPTWQEITATAFESSAENDANGASSAKSALTPETEGIT